MAREKFKRYRQFESEIIEQIPSSTSYRNLANRIGHKEFAGGEFNKYVRSLGQDLSHFTVSHPGSTRYNGLINQKHNKLTVLDIIRTRKDDNISILYYAKCRCECGTEKLIRPYEVIKGITKSCGCIRDYEKIVEKRKKNQQWAGVGEIPKSFLSKIKRGAFNRGLKFDLTLEYLWDIFLKQNKSCKFSGERLYFSSVDIPTETTASVDRIDNNKGYIPGNVQFVHKEINIMRGSLTIEQFLLACRKIANNADLSEG